AGGAAERAWLVARGAGRADGHQPRDPLAARTGRAESDRGDADHALQRLWLDALTLHGRRRDARAEPDPGVRAGELEGSGERLSPARRVAAGAGAARGAGRGPDAAGRDGVVRRRAGCGARAPPVDARRHAHDRRRGLALHTRRGRQPPLRPQRAVAVPGHRQARGAVRDRDRPPMSEFTIAEWRPGQPVAGSLDEELDMLAVVLHAVVHTGAGVSFVVPFSIAEARAFWADRVLPGVLGGSRRV